MVKFDPSKGKINMKAEFKEGWSYIRGNTIVLLINILVALIGFFGFSFSQQIPAIARDVLSRIADTEEAVAARSGALYLAQGVGTLVAALLILCLTGICRHVMMPIYE